MTAIMIRFCDYLEVLISLSQIEEENIGPSDYCLRQVSRDLANS